MVAEELFGANISTPLVWKGGAVVDDFATPLSMSAIAEVCQAVGFNTIPAWARPFKVLSNGEKFRVELARRLVEQENPIVVDEFTSVVDRQVAQIGSYAVAKYVRNHDKQFVGVSCHHDIVEWLQPDWVFEPVTMTFTRREGLQRPAIDVEITRVHYKAWQLFAPFHYMSPDLYHARCFLLLANGEPASFVGVKSRSVGKKRLAGPPIMGVSRVVTLPDWQGLGLAMVLLDTLGSAYQGAGYRFRMYPAHPGFVRTFKKSPRWKQTKAAGIYSDKVNRKARDMPKSFYFPTGGGRPCGVFEYVGTSMAGLKARALIGTKGV